MARTKYYQIQSKYGRSWEDVHATTTKKDAVDALKSYRENDPRTQHRRVIRYEKAAKALGGARAAKKTCVVQAGRLGPSIVSKARGRVVNAINYPRGYKITAAVKARAAQQLSCKFTARKK